LPGGVSSLAQTEDGKLWVGTEFGLFHFDGISSTAWEPTVGVQKIRELITALEPTRGGGLWIGTWTDCVLFRWRKAAKLPNRRWRQTPSCKRNPCGQKRAASGLVPWDSIPAVLPHWHKPATVLQGFDGGGVHSLFEDHAKNIWIGCTNGLYRWDGTGYVMAFE
jgi:ligand-binding sensor domain-containing protein